MSSFIGHEMVRSELERLAALSEAPQSFLFSGPRHVGKRLVALWFAEKLIAENIQGSFPQNLLMIEPVEVASAKRVREHLIPVESIREAQKFLALSPMGGKRRVLMIDGAEKLGVGAANALLKILEEPPEKSVIILLSAEPGNLLPTILSRVVNIHFRPVSSDCIKQEVTGASGLPQFFLDLGLPGVVIDALESSEQFASKKQILRNLFQISKLSLRERIALAEELSRDEASTRDILEIWCIGLVFQARSKNTIMTSHYLFLEQALRTLKSLNRGEGAPRLLLEKLFFSL